MDILFIGVGGQGVLFASELMAHAAMINGLDVKKSEVHGMAQRGGSVMSGVRFGEKIYSPTIEKANVICSLELIETLRSINYLKPDGKVFINNHRIVPITAFIGNVPYPDDPIQMIKKLTNNVVLVNALKIAKNSGNPRATNIVMLGAVSTVIDFPEKIWEKAIEGIGKFVEVNKKAFFAGREAVK